MFDPGPLLSKLFTMVLVAPRTPILGVGLGLIAPVSE